MAEEGKQEGIVSTTQAVESLKEPRGAVVEGEKKPRVYIPGQERRRVRGLDEEILIDVRGRLKDNILHFQEVLDRTEDPVQREGLQQAIDIFTAVSSLSPQERDPNAVLLTCAAGTLLEEMLQEEQEKLFSVPGTDFARKEKAEALAALAELQQLRTLASLAAEEATKDPLSRKRAKELARMVKEKTKKVEEKVRIARILEIEWATDKVVKAGKEVFLLEKELIRVEGEVKQAGESVSEAEEELKKTQGELDRILPPELKKLEQKKGDLKEERRKAEEEAKKAVEEARQKTEYLQSREYQNKLRDAEEMIKDAKSKEKTLEKNVKDIEEEEVSEERNKRLAEARIAHSKAVNERIQAEREKARIEQEAQRAQLEAEKKAQEAEKLAREKKEELDKVKRQINRVLRKTPNRQEIEDKRKDVQQKEQALKEARKEKEEKEAARQKAKEALNKAKQELIEAQSLVKQLQAAERRRKLMEDDLKVLRREIDSLAKTLWESRSRFDRFLAWFFGEGAEDQTRLEKEILRRLGVTERWIRAEERRRATQIMIEEILRDPRHFSVTELGLEEKREEIVAREEEGAREGKEAPPAEPEIAKAREEIEGLSPKEREELQKDLAEPDPEKQKELIKKWAERLGIGAGLIALIFYLVSQAITAGVKESWQ